MATCTVTLTSSVTAVSGRVKYAALANQVIAGEAIDVTEITASVSTTDYTATLTRLAKYRIIAPAFAFHDKVFTVPASATADLTDLLDGLRTS